MNRSKGKNKKTAKALNAQSSSSHSQNIPRQTRSNTATKPTATTMEGASTSNISQQQQSKKPIPISQAAADDLVEELNLSNDQAEKFEIFLKRFLEPGVKITGLYEDPNDQFLRFFTENNGKSLVYCNSIEKLMQAMNHTKYNAPEWRLHIEFPESHSVKMALFHDSPKKPTIPIAYAVPVKDLYDVMKFILQKLD